MHSVKAHTKLVYVPQPPKKDSTMLVCLAQHKVPQLMCIVCFNKNTNMYRSILVRIMCLLVNICIASLFTTQVEGKIKNFKFDYGSKNKKSNETRERLKVVKQGRSHIPANILVDI